MSVEDIISKIKLFLQNRMDVLFAYTSEEVILNFTVFVIDIYYIEDVVVISYEDGVGYTENEIHLDINMINDIDVIKYEEEDYELLRIFFKNGSALDIF